MTENKAKSKLKDYKAIVKKKYPQAGCIRDGALHFVFNGKKDLGAGFGKEAAWRSAAINEKLIK